MSTTYGQIEREVHHLLANIVGGQVSDVETNYTAASSTSNRLNPDFAFTPVRDAIIEAIIEIFHAIAETPRHPHWNIYSTFTSSLSNGNQIPNTSPLAEQLIGAFGDVVDSATTRVCLPMPLDKVRDYNIYSSTVYSGLDVYWYALDGFRIFHTRSAVKMQYNVLTRPTFVAANNITLYDNHVPFIVWGAVARLAIKEGRYREVYEAANQHFNDYLASIRAWSQATGTEDAYIPSAA